MTEEELKEKYKKQREEHYQKIADDVYLLYRSFKNAGFTNDRAFELVSHYLRQSILDNIASEQMRKGNAIDRLTKRNRELLNKLQNKE